MTKSKTEIVQLLLLALVVLGIIIGLVVYILNKVSKKRQINIGEEVDNLVKCKNNKCSQ